MSNPVRERINSIIIDHMYACLDSRFLRDSRQALRFETTRCHPPDGRTATYCSEARALIDILNSIP